MVIGLSRLDEGGVVAGVLACCAPRIDGDTAVVDEGASVCRDEGCHGGEDSGKDNGLHVDLSKETWREWNITCGIDVE